MTQRALCAALLASPLCGCVVTSTAGAAVDVTTSVVGGAVDLTVGAADTVVDAATD